MNQFCFYRRGSGSSVRLAASLVGLLMTGACSAPLGVKTDPAGTAGKSAGSAGRRASDAAEGGSQSSAGKGAAGAKVSTDDGKAKADAGTQPSGAAGDDSDNAAGASASAGAAAEAGSYANGGVGGQGSDKPAMTADACAGKASEYACDGTVLYHCTNDSGYDKDTHCKTPGQCKAGLKSGECGMCDPGTSRCNAQSPEIPETCTDEGTWKQGTACASAALCNSDTGSCDMSGCMAGDLRCNGDALEVCNDDLTGFTQMKDCGMGLCNADKKACMDCVPGSSASCKDASTLVTCTDDGKTDEQPCGSASPVCAKDKCVECMAASDCQEPPSECHAIACNNNKCGDGAPVALRTKCSSGVCDVLGNCVPCVVDDDCHDPQLQCLTGLRCVSRNPLQVAPLITGGYSVQVAPGFSVKIVDRSNVPDLLILNPILPVSGAVLPKNASDTVTYLFSSSAYPQACSLPQVSADTVTLGFGAKESSSDASAKTCSSGMAPTIELKVVQ